MEWKYEGTGDFFGTMPRWDYTAAAGQRRLHTEDLYGWQESIKGAMLCFLHSDLCSACLGALFERKQAAEREELKPEIMLEETPWLCKNRDQICSLSAKIRGSDMEASPEKS